MVGPMPITRYVLEHDIDRDFLVVESMPVHELGKASPVMRIFSGRTYRTPDREQATRFDSALEAELMAFTHRPRDAHYWRWECLS